MAEPARDTIPGLLLVGIVTGARGLKGDLRIRCLADDPAFLEANGPLVDAERRRRFAVTVLGAGKGQVLARIDGIADRAAAEALKGQRLYLPREAMPEAGEDEFYYADLAGLRVELGDGTPLGTVRWVYDFGAGDVLEIEGVDNRPLMVPFTRRAVPVVDLAAGRLVVDPPDGLLEPPKPEDEHG